MAKKPPAPLDPRLRPFRIGAYALYLVVVVAFSLDLIFYVVKSVQRMSPGRQPASMERLTVAECAAHASGLWGQLERERENLGHAPKALRADVSWTDFRVRWLNELRADESRCQVETSGREDVREVFRQLEKVEDLYTTAAVQYAGEIGPSVDRLRALLVGLTTSHR